jgi:hypothetical protein
MKPDETIRRVYCYSLFNLTDSRLHSTNNNSLHFHKCFRFSFLDSSELSSGFTVFTSFGSSFGNIFTSFSDLFSSLSGLGGFGGFSGSFLDFLGSLLGSIFNLLSGSIILGFLGLVLNRFNSGFDSFLNFFFVFFVFFFVFSFIEFLLDLGAG